MDGYGGLDDIGLAQKPRDGGNQKDQMAKPKIRFQRINKRTKDKKQDQTRAY